MEISNQIDNSNPWRRAAPWLLASVILLAILVALLSPAVPQDLAYHSFVDQRRILDVPNFWNVVTNLPFIPAGVAGVWLILGKMPAGGLASQRIAYLIFFAGVSLVAFGSGYYHLQPSNDSLVWDRLPMTLAFMSFTAAIVGENINERAGRFLLWPLLMIGLLSVAYWHYTETQGMGDLRLYALVQFLPILIIPLILFLFDGYFENNHWLWIALLAYAAAKVAELADVAIYETVGFSGHSIKHLLAALGALALLQAIRRRTPRSVSEN